MHTHSPDLNGRGKQEADKVDEPMNVWQEGGLLGNTGTPGGVECNVRCHHHALVLVLRLIVHNNGIDRVSLNPCWSHATNICHGIEMDFIGTAGTP